MRAMYAVPSKEFIKLDANLIKSSVAIPRSVVSFSFRWLFLYVAELSRKM